MMYRGSPRGFPVLVINRGLNAPHIIVIGQLSRTNSVTDYNDYMYREGGCSCSGGAVPGGIPALGTRNLAVGNQLSTLACLLVSAS